MNDLEEQIAQLPLPELSDQLCTRIESVLSDTETSKSPSPVATDRFGWSRRLAIAAAVLVIAVLPSLWPSGNGQRLVFAQVQKAITKIDSMEYTFTHVYFEGLDSVPVKGKDGSFRQVSDLHGHAKELASYYGRTLPEIKGEKQRQETGSFIQILEDHSDQGDGKIQHAFLARQSKGRKRYEQFFPFEQVTIDIHNSVNDIERMTSVPAEAVRDLGRKQMDGENAVGFQLIKEMNGGIVRRDYWVSAKTRLPMRIEHRFFEIGSEEPTELSWYSNFVYNVRIDDEMFERTSLSVNWSLPAEDKLVDIDSTQEVVNSNDSFHDSDVSQLSKRALVDVTYERLSFNRGVIVTFRTIGPSHGSDTRPEFPREDILMVIQGKKGAVVFESGLPWKNTGDKTIDGKPTYSARVLVHSEMKNGLILTESRDGFDDEPTIGIVTFHSLFKN